MHFAQLRAVAVLATASTAFLLPPTISSSDKDIIQTLPFEQAAAIDGRVVNIECPPGFPVQITNLLGETKTAASSVSSVLRLNFSLSHNDADVLLLNGLQIYPINPLSQSFLEPLTADQLVKSPQGTWNYAASPRLGYSLSVRHPVKASNDDQLDLIALHLEISEVGDRFIDGFPIVDVKLLETPSRKLMIGDVEISPAGLPTSGGSCTTIICKWRAIVAEKLSELKGCGGKARPHKGQTMKPAADQEDGHRHGGHGRPRPHGPHRPHRHHHRHNRFARFLRNIVLHVFIPVMIGVVLGVTASLIGMIVGHLIIFIWRAFFRRGKSPAYIRVAAEDDGENGSKSLDQHELPPPVYEEAPAYEEAVVSEKPLE
jgi:hypothetical protein